MRIMEMRLSYWNRRGECYWIIRNKCGSGALWLDKGDDITIFFTNLQIIERISTKFGKYQRRMGLWILVLKILLIWVWSTFTIFIKLKFKSILLKWLKCLLSSQASLMNKKNKNCWKRYPKMNFNW
jgi:hypothetical protein